jgi:cellulose synthase/poly-beta-1,6-N-acetylglucosamine synthase-like glycosyltransferase
LSTRIARKRDVINGIADSTNPPLIRLRGQLLAYRLNQSGFKIKYCDDVIAYHPARDSLQGFFKWHFKRGISSYLFAKKVDRKKEFFLLRIRSTVNILRHNCVDYKFPLIFLLLCGSYLAQLLGLLSARINKE